MPAFVREATELLEKANADLEPELLDDPAARELLDAYSRVRRLADFGIAALAGRIQEASSVARATGTSVARAGEAVKTGQVIRDSRDLDLAMRLGEISLDQAREIALAEEAAPGAAAGLLEVARDEAFHVLREKALKVKLEAEQHRDLAERQHEARRARTRVDEQGMVEINLVLEPHVGTPIVARAEAEASRLARAAKKGNREPFERHLADGYAALLQGGGSGSGSGSARTRRPEMVILVSHGVAKRGWKSVEAGEACKIPGVGPVPPQVAREIARDAFLNGVFFDGTDLRHFKRWSRHIPVEVLVALELGSPPEFDGIACVDCGNRFRTEFDHIEPWAAGGPTSNGNVDPRCWNCHQEKTRKDRKAGKLRPPEP